MGKKKFGGFPGLGKGGKEEGVYEWFFFFFVWVIFGWNYSIGYKSGEYMLFYIDQNQ